MYSLLPLEQLLGLLPPVRQACMDPAGAQAAAAAVQHIELIPPNLPHDLK
jgi:hypothetical protein